MTREKLTKLYFINKEIELWEKMLKKLEYESEGKALKISAVPGGIINGKPDPTGDIASDKADVVHMIKMKKKELQKEQQEILQYIMQIKDPLIRLIIYYRHYECKSWEEVAESIGGGTSQESVRKQHDRFLEKEERTE